MDIDWFTVAAQVINFLILVVLLQRFLYGPIVRAMDRREQRITARLHEAAEKKEEAENEARDYRRKSAALDAQRESELAEARQEAEDLRHALHKEVRRETEETRRKWREQTETERDQFLRDLRREAAQRFYALARRALGDLASAGLEEQIVDVFVARLDGMDRETAAKVAAAARAADRRIELRSAFELPPATRRRITRSVHEALGEEFNVVYARSMEIACGIELRAGAQTVMWSLDGYLDALETGVAESLGQIAAGGESEPALRGA